VCPSSRPRASWPTSVWYQPAGITEVATRMSLNSPAERVIRKSIDVTSPVTKKIS